MKILLLGARGQLGWQLQRSGGQWGIDAIAQMSKQVPALLRHTCDVATSTACCAW